MNVGSQKRAEGTWKLPEASFRSHLAGWCSYQLPQTMVQVNGQCSKTLRSSWFFNNLGWFLKNHPQKQIYPLLLTPKLGDGCGDRLIEKRPSKARPRRLDRRSTPPPPRSRSRKTRLTPLSGKAPSRSCPWWRTASWPLWQGNPGRIWEDRAAHGGWSLEKATWLKDRVPGLVEETSETTSFRRASSYFD